METSVFDLVIRNGTVVTASDTARADIGVRDGAIAAIGRGLAGRETIDAEGRYVLPGGVDTHCHVEQMTAAGIMNADTFESATRSAAFGGTTTIISFAAQHRGMDLAEVVADYHRRAEAGAMIDYAFHMIVTDAGERNLAQLPRLVRDGHGSIKLFMTYDPLIVDDAAILSLMQLAKAEGAMICVHAENHSMIAWASARLIEAGCTAPKYQALAHPREAEAEAIGRLIALCEYMDQPVTVFHVSTSEGLALIAAARRRGVRIFAETCPHYLLLTADDMDKPGMEGAKWMCSPPLRRTSDQEALWQGLAAGDLTIVSSDHAPFRHDATGKLRAGPTASFKQIANGMPGLETRMMLMFDQALQGRISLNRMVDLTATTPAKTYNLHPRKGTIAVGADADLVLWNPETRVTLADAMIHDGTGYTPFAGRTIQGWPETVLVRGTPVVRDGATHVPPGFGQFLRTSGKL
ncbi:dihydropyrimidinase [Rhizobiaceae bacterium BDR2-2]|uniref:D-hydantoinase n=1 Tax=Ectorhizobium quercum TaxID=2965071 RepID=A0AAE3MZP7_9HYPH|nr:dihydropyrimidinase [Ectorhizobium quercum]MCX8997431.1 dihydropyrimidinase [Ectorhizobium quercum]